MGYLVLSNFKANGVKGHPGKVLSSDEVAKIGKAMPALVAAKAVSESNGIAGESATLPPVVPAPAAAEPAKPKSGGKKSAKG